MSKMKMVVILLVAMVMSLTAGEKKLGTEKNNCTPKMENQKMVNLEENKKIALGLSEAIMNGDWKKVNELISDDFTYEADGRPAVNKQQYIGFMKGVLTTAMTDMDMKFLHVVAEDDLVSVNYTNEMTNNGAFMGIPATGKRVNASGQFIREIKNGKVTAEWQTTNALSLMKDLGVIPSK